MNHSHTHQIHSNVTLISVKQSRTLWPILKDLMSTFSRTTREHDKTYIFCTILNLACRAALGGGRSTLANQGSLYHASWRPRLPDAFESGGGEKQAETVEAP